MTTLKANGEQFLLLEKVHESGTIMYLSFRSNGHVLTKVHGGKWKRAWKTPSRKSELAMFAAEKETSGWKAVKRANVTWTGPGA